MSRIQSSIIALALFGLAAYVAVLLFANMNAVVPISSVKAWQQKKVLPQESSWQLNLNRIQAAIKLDSSNPDFLETEAQLYLYRAYMFKVNSDEAVAAYRVALAKYQHLLTLRPSWAPYWGSIVSIKYDLWEYDEVMVEALHNAARLAPWFRSNQHNILRAGFHGWPFINQGTREVISRTFERAMQLQPRETIKLALSQGFSDRIDAYIEGDEQLKELYKKEILLRKKELLK